MNSLKKEKMNLKMKTKKLTIAFEDKNLLIVDKPAKLLTIGTTKEKERTLYHEVLTYLHKKNQKKRHISKEIRHSKWVKTKKTNGNPSCLRTAVCLR